LWPDKNKKHEIVIRNSIWKIDSHEGELSDVDEDDDNDEAKEGETVVIITVYDSDDDDSDDDDADDVFDTDSEYSKDSLPDPRLSSLAAREAILITEAAKTCASVAKTDLLSIGRHMTTMMTWRCVIGKRIWSLLAQLVLFPFKGLR
jgi:hypothetical protein